MQGVDWDALPIVCEMLGVDDPDELIRQLLVIREFNDRRAKANA